MSFEIKDATRQGIKPLIGVYGESGCGKTYSALLLARGFAGPSGKIIMIDTENGRGSLYADVLPGGYDVIQLDEPFSPSRYVEAIQAAERGGANIIVIDSMSHEHEGIGGVLDMAGESEAKSGKPGLHNWRLCKMEHAKMMQKLLRSSVPVICCVRAKYKTRQIKENGRTQIVKDDHTSPIQSEDFIYELTAHFEVMPDHTIHLTKHSHPSLKECFPEDYKEPVSIKHGELIAVWANGGGAKSKPQVQPDNAPTDNSTRDFFLQITEATDGAELTRLVEEYTKLPSEDDQKKARRTIMAQASILHLKWDEKSKTFITP